MQFRSKKREEVKPVRGIIIVNYCTIYSYMW